MKSETVFIEILNSNVVELFDETSIDGTTRHFVAVHLSRVALTSHKESRALSPSLVFRTVEEYEY